MKIKLDLCKGILGIIAKEFNFSLDNIIERQRAVKTIYILNHGGMRLGYGFSWYIYGPYSDDFSSDLREVLTYPEYEETKNRKKWNFSKDSWKRIHEIDSKFIKPLDNQRKLELMTSMHFMYYHWYENETSNEMKELFRKKHRNETVGDNSPITDEQLDNALVYAANLIAYKKYYKRDNSKSL